MSRGSTVTAQEVMAITRAPAARGRGRHVIALSVAWGGGRAPSGDAQLTRVDEDGESTWRYQESSSLWDRPQIEQAVRPDQAVRLARQLTGLARIHGARISRTDRTY